MAAARRIERRNAHQPVHAVLAFQKAVGIVPFNEDGRAFQARLVAVQVIQRFHVPAVARAKARIHAEQHLGPVLRLRAARARMEGKDGVVRVVLARQKRHKAHLLHLFGQGVHRLPGLLSHGLVRLVLGTHLQKRLGIAAKLLQLAVVLQPLFYFAHLGKHLAGIGRIVVKGRVCTFILQLLQAQPAALDGQSIGQVRHLRLQLRKAALHFIQ